MSHLIVSEISHVLLVVAMLSRIVRRLVGGRRGAWIGFALGAVLTVLPQDYSPTFYTRGMLGELSALSLVFLIHFLVKGTHEYQLIPRREGFYISVSGLVAAVLIYPGSLGVNVVPDFYEFGFAGYGVLLSAGALCGFFLWRRCLGAAVWVGLGLTLYGFKLHPSLNFWDCLVDVSSVMVCAGFLFYAAWRRLRMPSNEGAKRGGTAQIPIS
jgi:hypothetical protein